MLEWLTSLPIVFVALIMGCFCWLCTSLGASCVFFCTKLNKKYFSALLAFAGGIMLASSFFSLILPALESCQGVQWKEIVFVVGGLILGGSVIFITNQIFDKKFANRFKEKNPARRAFLVTSSITLHNIPEGMAVGIAIGSVAVGGDVAHLLEAIILGVGIGIQNIPEGASVSLALHGGGTSAKKSFFAGVGSGLVEPISAVLACLLAYSITFVMPMFLAFASGAMMLVALTELIPEAINSTKIISTIFLLAGFSLMMILEIII